MERNDKKKKQARETPIIDGDARPDINLNPEEKPKPDVKRVKDSGKTTQNRVDKNNLEDFRDAR
jgi:hypothetical protein